jgi:hypothetical protein
VLRIEGAEPAQRVDHVGGNALGAQYFGPPCTPRCPSAATAPRTTLLDVVHESVHGRGVVRRFHAPRNVVRQNQAIDPQAGLLLSNPIDFTVQEPERGTDFKKART